MLWVIDVLMRNANARLPVVLWLVALVALSSVHSSRPCHAQLSPFLRHLSLPTQAHAVKPHIWARFLVTCPEDRDTLERCLNEHLQGAWRPDVTSAATRQSSEVSHPLGHAREYQGFKVQATLDAALEAPPTIKAMLCDFANINQRLVFRQDATLEGERAHAIPLLVRPGTVAHPSSAACPTLHTRRAAHPAHPQMRGGWWRRVPTSSRAA